MLRDEVIQLITKLGEIQTLSIEFHHFLNTYGVFDSDNHFQGFLMDLRAELIKISLGIELVSKTWTGCRAREIQPCVSYTLHLIANLNLFSSLSDRIVFLLGTPIIKISYILINIFSFIIQIWMNFPFTIFVCSLYT